MHGLAWQARHPWWRPHLLVPLIAEPVVPALTDGKVQRGAAHEGDGLPGQSSMPRWARGNHPHGKACVEVGLQALDQPASHAV